MLLIGIMHSISEQPRRTWGSSNSQKSQSLVSPVTIQVPAAKPVKPIPIRMRGSTLPENRPAMGAVANMHKPETNIVSPICRAE